MTPTAPIEWKSSDRPAQALPTARSLRRGRGEHWRNICADLGRITRNKPTPLRLAYHYVCSPGFRAAFLYRIAHLLNAWGRDRLATWVTSHCVSSTGCEIRAGAEIGPGLALYHPVGIVIGGGASIGSNCTILQHVTIGERYGPHDGHRCATVGDGVTLGAGAVLLGPVTVGAGALIGANSVVLDDVPAAAVIAGSPARIIHSAHLPATAVQPGQ